MTVFTCLDVRRQIALLLCALAILLASLPAQAQFATGGTGLHRGRIFWVSWGNDGEDVYSGRTVTRGFYVDTPNIPQNYLEISCTLSGASTSRGSSGLYVYTPGGWQGDGLDELYNIGGNHPGTGANPNTLRVGLRTNNSATVSFNFACNATLGGAPFALSGLVFADAEASGGSEYVGAQLTGGGTVRVIDQVAQCRNAQNQRTAVSINGTGTNTDVRFGAATPASCENNATASLRAGPALVGFIDGATSARVTAYGGGISAVAVGAVLELEFSEAIPASYGNAVHVRNAIWSGGEAVTGRDYHRPDNQFLATVGQGIRLGPTVQADPNANGPVGGPDVDALPKTTGPAGAGYANVAAPNVLPGGTYTIPNVVCTGPAVVAGWIDFNGNGVFDAGERSAQATCPSGSGSVNLTWTIPASYQPQATTYMRLRLASDASGVANATGVATNGEAEDYRLALPQLVPQVSVAKVSQSGTGTFNFSLTNLSATSVPLTTATAGVAVQSSPFQANSAADVAITEAVPGPGWVLDGASCIDNNAAITGNPATFGSLSGTTLTVPGGNVRRARADIVCTFQNALRLADLSVTKTNNSEQVVAGTATTYVLTVTNHGSSVPVTGAVVRDAPTEGLSCPAANAVTCSGPAGACPGSGLTVGALTSAGGLTLGTLQSGASLTLQFTCNVP